MPVRHVGIVGFGNLGQFLAGRVHEDPDLKLCFVWNRTVTQEFLKLDKDIRITSLEDFVEKKPDLIVEVAHPCISEDFGQKFLEHADYMVGSPTALASTAVETLLRKSATVNGMYVPSGAFWGGEDIRKMADLDTLKSLTVTMRKHPSSLKVGGVLNERKDAVTDKPVVLFEGPVRDLCPLAPNNVNTMAAAAVAAHNLGFSSVVGRLVADPGLLNSHIVEVEVGGPGGFTVNTVRHNPAQVGKVTGEATYNSFWTSLLRAKDKGPGVHLC